MSYPDSFTCRDCGRKHQLDASLPSEIWNRIAQPGDVLCIDCIDRRAEAAGVTAEAEFYYIGAAIKSRSYTDSWGERQEIKRRVAELEAALRQLAELAEAQSLQTLFTKTVARTVRATLGGGAKS